MKLTMWNIIGIVGGLLLIIGTLLPWISVTTGSVNIDITGLTMGANLIGLPLIIFGIIGLVMCLIGGKGPGIVGIVFGVLAVLFSIFGLVLVTWIAQLAGYGGVGDIVTTGFGTYICIIGSILLIVGSVMVIGQKKTPPAPAPMAPPPAQ